MEKAVILDHVCSLLRSLDSNRKFAVTADIDILTQLDFDSLQMLDLAEELNKLYRVNLLNDPYSIEDLRTPETITAAIVAALVKEGSQ